MNYANIIPGGMVVFLPSYAVLNSFVGAWKSSQLLPRLAKVKQVFIEHKEPGTNVLSDYTEAVKKFGGAILFAVVGGSLSEGINFSDELGRAVVMIGVPFANIKSPELVEKMAFINSLKVENITGQDYYENMCMKAVNQCIGFFS